ncbi:MAG: hypothetical protein ACLP0J_28760 [Solirubrobacteraceae bacterium]
MTRTHLRRTWAPAPFGEAGVLGMSGLPTRNRKPIPLGDTPGGSGIPDAASPAGVP